MIEIVKEIFKNNNFHSIADEGMIASRLLEGIEEVFVNQYDEMYFILTGQLKAETLKEINNLCAKVERQEKLPKGLKANWVVVYMTELKKELSNEDKNYIMKIEENKFYCRKYVFWYTREDKTALTNLCNNRFTNENLTDKIKDYTLFSEFKNKQNRGYECLARLYIKLPFLNLQQIPITTTTIFGCVEDQLKKINEEVVTLFENGDLEEILNYVDVSEKDIEKEMKKLEEK